MIHANRIVTVGEQESIIDRPIILYRGDREVEIEFTLVGNEFTFSEEGNVIKSVNASHGQLVLNTPSGEHMFSELAECHEGKVVFVVTKEMIDEFIEMGFYSFQIRLYDSAEMKSRVTIPPVMNGFDIRNPIAAEDETNVVDQGIVDYARIFKDQSNEELPTFDWTGAYNKTEWEHHDVITENKMNKIEDALYSINANIKESDVFMLNALDNVKKDADKYVKEHMAEVEQDVKDFERNLNTDVQKFKIDTNVALESVNEQLGHITTNLKSNISLESYEHLVSNIGTSDECWANAFEQACNDLKDGGILYCIGRQYQFKTSIVIPSHIKLVGIKSSTIFKYNGTGTFVTLENMTVIENITFKGDGASKNQIGVHITSWNGVLKQCNVMDFYKGVLCTGVLITIDNCYIVYNDTGVEVEQVTKSDGSKIFSTMVTIANSLIHYNNVGVFADGTGDSDRDVVMFTIENCGIEHNSYGLKLPAVMLGSIKKCWFEANTNNSEVKPWGWVLEQNRFEKDDKINWICGEWDTWSGNAITQIESNTIKSRKVTLQRFEESNKTIVDYDLFINNSGDLECGGEYIKKIPSNGTNHKYLKTYYVLINNGNVRSTNLPVDSYSLKKTATGRYCLSLSSGYAFYLPIINANATNKWGGGAVTCAVQTHNSINEADYKNWFTVNEIAFVCKNVETNEDVDATVMVTIHCQKIETSYGI